VGAPAAPTPWLGIELRHLAALQAVAEEGTFVRAAARLGYTQSAVSNQIASLERIVSARLVERSRGGTSVTLTEAGRVLVEHAGELVARLSAARADVAAATSGSPATLRVGYFQSVGTSVLPQIVAGFREQHPATELDFELGDAGRGLQEIVAAGDVDIAFVSAPLRVDTLSSRHVYDDRFALLGPAEEAQRGLRPDFAARPLLAYRPCHDQLALERELHRLGVVPRDRVVAIEDAATIQALVRHGCAYALLPALAVEDSALVLDVFDTPRRAIHVVWHRDRDLGDAGRAFVDAAAAAFANHDALAPDAPLLRLTPAAR